MSAITRFFFRAPYSSQTTWSVVRWWESRRPAYNLAVGAAGILALAAITLQDAFLPTPKPGIPWGFVLVYGILANLFYCFGPAVDALICRRWGPNFGAVGPTLFRYGFVFAVGLTLLPVPLALFGWAIRILGLVH